MGMGSDPFAVDLNAADARTDQQYFGGFFGHETIIPACSGAVGKFLRDGPGVFNRIHVWNLTGECVIFLIIIRHVVMG